tara:strand:- start:26497 stop:27384 length:888 start_codon:yes stop_codon:yes gene_type:complete
LNKKIICFGEILWDIYPDKIQLGGAPYNVFCRLNSFGINTEIVSSIGNDDLGLKIIETFKKNNYSSKYIQLENNYSTGKVMIELKNGEPKYSISENVAWDFISLPKKYIKDFDTIDILIYGSLASRNNESFSTLEEILKNSNYKILDLNIRQNYFNKEKLDFLIDSSDFLKVNLDELILLNQLFELNISNTQKLSESICKRYNLDYICITNGSVDSTIYDGTNFYKINSFSVKSVDSVGAGDSFLAAFVSNFFFKKVNIHESLRIASAYGALTSAKKGATPNISNQEIKNFIKNS